MNTPILNIGNGTTVIATVDAGRVTSLYLRTVVSDGTPEGTDYIYGSRLNRAAVDGIIRALKAHRPVA